MTTVYCRVDPASCTWSYSADRAVFAEAAWRIHYADHGRGEAALADYARTGTTHPVARPSPPASRVTRYAARADTTYGRFPR